MATISPHTSLLPGYVDLVTHARLTHRAHLQELGVKIPTMYFFMATIILPEMT